MKERDEYNEILAALALDALDETEARRLAAEIADDAALNRELAELRDTAAELAFFAAAVEPAPECLDKILTAIKKDNFSSVSENGASTKLNVAETTQPAVAPKSNVLAFPAAKQRRFASYVPLVGAIAASIIAVALAVALANSIGETNRVRAEVAGLNQKLNETGQRLSELSDRFERESQERKILASPSSVVRALNGSGTVPTAKARLVIDPKTNRAMLFVENLPDAPAGKAYQIWWMNDPTKPAPGATFHTTADGKGELRDQVSDQFAGARIYAVTLEPEGGSTAPTSTPVLVTSVL